MRGGETESKLKSASSVEWLAKEKQKKRTIILRHWQRTTVVNVSLHDGRKKKVKLAEKKRQMLKDKLKQSPILNEKAENFIMLHTENERKKKETILHACWESR